MADVIDRGGPMLGDGTRDYNHATDGEYKRLRQQADDLFKKRSQLSKQSQQAYKAGDGQKAHDLSEQAKKLASEADGYNRKAAEYVFRENNTDSAGDEIDLHGLFVKEAELFLQARIISDIKAHQSILKVIVGKGKHSKNGIAKIKPAIDEMCDESTLRHRFDSKNDGVLEIDLKGASMNQIPASWQQNVANQGYVPQQQPQYHQQPHQQGHNQQVPATGNTFLDLLIKGFCMCINK